MTRQRRPPQRRGRQQQRGQVALTQISSADGAPRAADVAATSADRGVGCDGRPLAARYRICCLYRPVSDEACMAVCRNFHPSQRPVCPPPPATARRARGLREPLADPSGSATASAKSEGQRLSSRDPSAFPPRLIVQRLGAVQCRADALPVDGSVGGASNGEQVSDLSGAVFPGVDQGDRVRLLPGMSTSASLPFRWPLALATPSSLSGVRGRIRPDSNSATMASTSNSSRPTASLGS